MRCRPVRSRDKITEQWAGRPRKTTEEASKMRSGFSSFVRESYELLRRKDHEACLLERERPAGLL